MTVSIQDVKSKYQEELMAKPGVVSVGIGRGANDEPAIVVGTDGEHPDVAAALPAELDGFPVRVDVIGRIRVR